MRSGLALILLTSLGVLASGAAVADLTSASYALRGSYISAGASAQLTSSNFAGTAATGQADGIGFAGSTLGLAAHAPGFMPILAGALPSLDLDADGIAFFLDTDDDGDGLLDVDETNTGVFASPNDTGTDSLNADSDGDGFGDGEEVLAGSDPTNSLSTPNAERVPSLGGAAQLALACLALVFGTLLSRRPRRSV